MTGRSRPRGAYTASPCPACRAPKRSRWYLCGHCWNALPEPVRTALNLHDDQAHRRLRELHAHIAAGLPLGQLEINP
ncbi:hypothetical protein [Streptomyces sp. NPDC007346]|uniref:hypothetical protein n=1 Tax=Streptomyces sp. NPDC007346 TaxID=3154682 RepID=UPI00345436B7